MKSGYYIISELHLTDSCEEFHVNDYVKIKTNNGDVFNAQIADIKQSEITLTFNDYIDGEITINYANIDSIEKIDI